MIALDPNHKGTVSNDLIEDSNIKGTAEKKVTKPEMWKVLFRCLCEVYRTGSRIKGIQVLPEFMSWPMELAV
jgi:hypothetical protein